MVDEPTNARAGSVLPDLRLLVREAVLEALREQQAAAKEVALSEERTQRAELEQKLNQLIEENRRARAQAEEADRHAAIRSELERLGVAKVELAFRAVRDDIERDESGKLIAKTPEGVESLTPYLRRFLDANPELLPARMTGGSGQVLGTRSEPDLARIDLDRIQPGMSAEELERVRQEIVRVANQAFRGM
jgi:hypothetical protein